MIYCVIPQALADELYEKLVADYEHDDNVTVIVNGRPSDRSSSSRADAPENRQGERRDRGRACAPGELPAADAPE
jgi:hypothetical protein